MMMVNLLDQAAAMTRWICLECSYIYNPGKGDPKHGVPPGTPFGQLPANWRCPECKVIAKAKHIFRPLD
jgi:rubredoxin